MENQFIPYELALKLKELGFDDECLGYFTNGILYTEYSGNDVLWLRSNLNAPLWQQAFDWLLSRANKYIGFDEYLLEIYNYQLSFRTTHDTINICNGKLECLEKLIEIVSYKDCYNFLK